MRGCQLASRSLRKPKIHPDDFVECLGRGCIILFFFQESFTLIKPALFDPALFFNLADLSSRFFPIESAQPFQLPPSLFGLVELMIGPELLRLLAGFFLLRAGSPGPSRHNGNDENQDQGSAYPSEHGGFFNDLLNLGQHFWRYQLPTRRGSLRSRDCCN